MLTVAIILFAIFPYNRYMEKFRRFHWLGAVQFLGNTVPRKEIQCQKKKFSANL